MSQLTPSSFRSARGFARHMLRENRLLIRPCENRVLMIGDFAIEMVLFRESIWQASLVIILPGKTVPRHRHNHVESYDVGIAGAGWTCVGDIARHLSATTQQANLAANLVAVPRGAWHDGGTDTTAGVFLSFQQWDGAPTFVGEDWEAA